MDEATFDRDKLSRLINIKRSDLDEIQSKEREEIQNDILSLGASGSGPTNQQLSNLYSKQLKELANIIVPCYLEAIEKNKNISQSIVKSISQQITSTINNQSQAFQHHLEQPMVANRLPKNTIDSTIRGFKIKTNEVIKYAIDSLIVGVKNRNEKLQMDDYNLKEINSKKSNKIDIFLSHSSHDTDIAEKLIDLLRISLNLSSESIRCTSVDGYRLPGGAKTDEQLRVEVHDSKILIGIITPQSLTSAFVLFELGARWGSGRPMIPLMAKGTNSKLLRGPLEGINCLSCDTSAQLHQLIDQIAKELNILKQNTSSFQNQIESLAGYSSQAKIEIDIKEEEKEQFIFEEGVYWIKKGAKKEGPFCQVCKDNNNKLIRLVNDDVPLGNGEIDHTRFCRVCGNHQ